ncbi:uncharacterized protein LY79DRAFT_262055 [Colletotrichum navitas]|uniref:2EXR domain-containing protein n=1 Tax=Colletotrichum navitas TaxID=681940 RepID=A0AAD8V3A7_9PEZI|nr:uncharacterized protein LY79DRAFT_262055 [Colletotrichum navitas]KAK1585637.1 hypothetical protein LY79DRAFT_262055 [Colletotrichum navitas]
MATELQSQTISLLEKIAQSQRVLEGRLDAIERLLGQQKPAPYFPQFRRLPPELRHRIWSLAIPTRVLRLSRRASKKHTTLHMSPPAIAQACREARAVATRNGGNVYLKHDTANPESPIRTTRHWFDSCQDVLELDRRVDVAGDKPRGSRDLVRDAQHILAPRAEAEWFARLFRQTAHLRRLSLMFDAVSVSSCAWDSGVVRRLFGDAGTVVTMDLENAGEIAWVKGVLREHWRNPVFCAFDLEAWARERGFGVGTGPRDEGWMRRLPRTWMSEVARGWVMAKAEVMAAEIGGEAGGWVGGGTKGQLDTEASEARTRASAAATLDMKDDFVRAALLAMPQVKLVRVFSHAEVHAGCRP